MLLHLHRFYTTSPNGVAMQVYAAALVHTAFRVAQGHIAQAVGIAPEEMSPAKFFPRLAMASSGLTWSELAFLEYSRPNRASLCTSLSGDAVPLPGAPWSGFRSCHAMDAEGSGGSVRVARNGNPFAISPEGRN